MNGGAYRRRHRTKTPARTHGQPRRAYAPAREAKEELRRLQASPQNESPRPRGMPCGYGECPYAPSRETKKKGGHTGPRLRMSAADERVFLMCFGDSLGEGVDFSVGAIVGHALL